MEVIFLDYLTLSVLDYGYANDNFTIIIDNVIPQSSSFEINKEAVSASVVKYVDSRYGFYTKKNYGTSNKCTIYLYEDEYNTYNSTIFFVKLSVGIMVAIPGNGSSGMSNVTIDYVYGGTNHTLVLGASSSEKALIFTCNTTSHYVKKVYAYR